MTACGSLKWYCVTICQPLEVGETAVGTGKVRRLVTGCSYLKGGCTAAPMVAFRMAVGKRKGTRTNMIGGRAVTPKANTANRREVVKPAVVYAIGVFFDGDEALSRLINLGQFNPLAVGGVEIVLSMLP